MTINWLSRCWIWTLDLAGFEQWLLLTENELRIVLEMRPMKFLEDAKKSKKEEARKYRRGMEERQNSPIEEIEFPDDYNSDDEVVLDDDFDFDSNTDDAAAAPEESDTTPQQDPRADVHEEDTVVAGEPKADIPEEAVVAPEGDVVDAAQGKVDVVEGEVLDAPSQEVEGAEEGGLSDAPPSNQEALE